jgi:hypothetical protein
MAAMTEIGRHAAPAPALATPAAPPLLIPAAFRRPANTKQDSRGFQLLMTVIPVVRILFPTSCAHLLDYATRLC